MFMMIFPEPPKSTPAFPELVTPSWFLNLKVLLETSPIGLVIAADDVPLIKYGNICCSLENADTFALYGSPVTSKFPDAAEPFMLVNWIHTYTKSPSFI